MCKKICKECPFSINALPGWLGPHSVQDIMIYKNTDYHFTCHMQRVDDINQNTSDSIDICKGYIVWATKSSHLFRDPELRKLQLTVSQEDKDEVLGLQEFYNKHNNI